MVSKIHQKHFGSHPCAIFRYNYCSYFFQYKIDTRTFVMKYHILVRCLATLHNQHIGDLKYYS